MLILSFSKQKCAKVRMQLIEVCITCCKKSDDEWMITVTGKITVKIIDWSIIR